LAVRLIDYDGLFVPALAGRKSGEVGHPAYQHPQRLLSGAYNAEVDRLPLLVIATALRALIVAGSDLWQRYDNGDNMLFREADLRAPAQSALCKELWQLNDAQTHALVGHLILASRRPLEHTPLLHELVTDGQIVPLSASEEMGVSALLALGSKADTVRAEVIQSRAQRGQREAVRAQAPAAAVLVAAPAGVDPRFDFEPPPLLLPSRSAGPPKWIFGVLAFGMVVLLSLALGAAIWIFGSGPTTNKTPHKGDKKALPGGVRKPPEHDDPGSHNSRQTQPPEQ
jgi:hypothetical protein